MEVRYFLTKEAGKDLPPGIEPPETMPDALFWLRLRETRGPLFSCGYLEQPWHFNQDLVAAEIGRQRFLDLQEANRRLREAHNATN